MQAMQNDKAKWHLMTQGAGSPQEILALKDSYSGPAGSSFGSEVGKFLPYHLVDFWMNLALCHALLVDTSTDAMSYQARSHTSCLVPLFTFTTTQYNSTL